MDGTTHIKTPIYSSLGLKDCFGILSMPFWALLCIYIGFFKSPSTWHKVTIANNICYGLVYFIIPKAALEGLEIASKVDGVHITFAYRIALMLFLSAATTYVCLGTDDSTVSASLLWTKVTSASLFGLLAAHSYLTSEKVSDKLVLYYIFMLLIICCWIMGLAAQLYRMQRFGGYTEHVNRLNVHLRIDSIFSIMIAASFLAFIDYMVKADTTVKSPDKLHLYLGRTLGVLYLEMGVFCDMATKFLFDMTKVRLLLCRFLGNAMSMIIGLGGLYYYGVLELKLDITLQCLVFAIYTLNALAGFLFSRYGQLKVVDEYAHKK